MTEPRDPLITVAIATYHRASDLERALKSVLAQPGDYFEVLIGDDASPDGTPTVVEEHRRDPRVRAYRNPVNLGMRDNYLKLMRAARGSYVFILTDDDYLLPGALDKILRIIQIHPDVGYILSDLPTVDERTGQIVNVHRTFPENRWIPSGTEFLQQVVRSAWVLSRQVVKREWIDWKTWESFKNNIYFPRIVAGRILLRAPAYYLADRLVMHTWFNQVHWDAFGPNRLEIEFNLARDGHDCLRAVLHDCKQTPEVLRIIEEWEGDSFKSYLYLPSWGFYDLLKTGGWRTGLAKLRQAYPLTLSQRRALWLFPLKIPFCRSWLKLKGVLKRALPAAVWARLRRMPG